jgi:hypothetical protein
MNRLKYLCAVVVVTFLAVGTSKAPAHPSQGGTPWVVHRTVDGQLTPESRQVAVKMRQKAVSEGHITLWLLPNYEGEWNPEEVTDEQHAQNCAEILQQLISQGHVWHPRGEPINHGPVCLVRASTAGVSILLQDDRFQQIMGAH